jgi:hypothetical protein
MAGFAPKSLKFIREQSQFLRLRRILRSCGHDLHRCPPGCPEIAEYGNYYATTADGEVAAKIDLGEWIADLDKPSTRLWHVTLRLALHSMLMSGEICRVESKPGFYRVAGPIEGGTP